MPTTELLFQGKDYPFSSVILHQKLASPIYLNKRRVRLSFGSHVGNSVPSYMTPRPDTISKKRNEVCNLSSHPTAGRGIGKSHRLKL